MISINRVTLLFFLSISIIALVTLPLIKHQITVLNKFCFVFLIKVHKVIFHDFDFSDGAENFSESGLSEETGKRVNIFPSINENHSRLCPDSDFSVEENPVKTNCMQEILTNHVVSTDPSPDNCNPNIGYSSENDSDTCDSSSLSDLISEYNQRLQGNCEDELRSEVKMPDHPLAALFSSENGELVGDCQESLNHPTDDSKENHELTSPKSSCKSDDDSNSKMEVCQNGNAPSPKSNSRTSPDTVDSESISRESCRTPNDDSTSELMDTNNQTVEPSPEPSETSSDIPSSASGCNTAISNDEELSSSSPSNDVNDDEPPTSKLTANQTEKSDELSPTVCSEKTENVKLSEEQKKKKRKENVKKRKGLCDDDDDDPKEKRTKVTNHRKNIRSLHLIDYSPPPHNFLLLVSFDHLFICGLLFQQYL